MMGRTTRLVGGASIVLAPLAWGISDELRMAAEPPATGSVVDTDYGVASELVQLATVAEHQGLFLTAAAVAFAGALLTITALLAIWRLSVDRSPRWAWAGATMAALGVIGQVVHLVAYYALTLTAVGQQDRDAAAQLIVDADTNPLLLALFVPFFVGLLFQVVQAVGLRRARIIPLWAVLAVVAATVFFAVVGSTPLFSAIWAGLLVAGFAPAAVAMLRGGAAVPSSVPQETVPARG